MAHLPAFRAEREEEQVASRVTQGILNVLYRRGLVVRRSLASRRQLLLDEYDVDVVLDVGAAVGEFGRELRTFGFTGDIASFEPIAAPYRRLAEAAADDPRWTTHHLALGRESGPASINVASNSDSSSLLPMAAEHKAAAPWVDVVGTEQIEVARLDDLADRVLPAGRTGFLKLDTQGFEREVLAGGTDTLGRVVGMQVELSFVPLYDGGPLVDEMLTAVYDLGFRMTGVDPGFGPGGAVLQADGLFFRTEAGS